MNSLHRRRGARGGSRRALLAGFCSVGGVLALALCSRVGSPFSPPDAFSLQVSAAGEVRAEGELLYDPASGDEFEKLRQRLVDVVKEAEREGARAVDQLILRAEPESPFESVQGIVDSCRGHQAVFETLSFAVGDEPEWPSLSPASEIELDEEDVVPFVMLEVVRIVMIAEEGPAEGERRIRYRVGNAEFGELAALEQRLKEMPAEVGPVRAVIDPRRGTRCGEVLSLLQAIDRAGLEEPSIAPRRSAVRERFQARWKSIVEGNWAAAYDFLTPERREQETVEQFLRHKKNHEYRDLSGVKVLEIRGDRAHVALAVWWKPTHPVIHTTGGGDEDLEQELEIVETWTRVEGQWFWLAAERAKEFLPAHPELKDR